MVSHIRNGHSGQRKKILDPGFQIGREDVLFVITDSRGVSSWKHMEKISTLRSQWKDGRHIPISQ